MTSDTTAGEAVTCLRQVDPTTPDERRYIESRLEEIGRGIGIRMGMPAAGAGIGTAGLAIGFSNGMAGMAGLRGSHLRSKFGYIQIQPYLWMFLTKAFYMRLHCFSKTEPLQ